MQVRDGMTKLVVTIGPAHTLRQAARLMFASPDWTLEQAATTMVKAGFRHLVVLEGSEVTGLLSMRDIVRCWAEADDRATARA
jgi:CBS domain-containing protein